MEAAVAPRGAAAAQGEQRAAQIPGPVRRDEPEGPSPRAPGDVVAAPGPPAADGAPLLQGLVGAAPRVARPQVRLAVQLRPVLGPAPEDARV